jgi:hypothetical protein
MSVFLHLLLGHYYLELFMLLFMGYFLPDLLQFGFLPNFFHYFLEYLSFRFFRYHNNFFLRHYLFYII